VRVGTPLKPSRHAIMLSALVMPGAGQFVQRRRVAAFFYGGIFLAAFMAVMTFAARLLVFYYSFGLSMERNPEPPNLRPDAIAVVVSLAVAVVIYLAGVLDTYLAYRREAAAWAEGQREDAFRRINGTSSGESGQGG
jgi:hypothetical protein